MNLRNKFKFNYKEENDFVKLLGFNPYYQIIESGSANEVTINGEKYINLASNDYLGFSSNREILCAMKDTLYRYGSSMCGTPVACGNIDLFDRTSKKASDFLNLEDTLIFPTCYQANIAVIKTLVSKNDVIFIDRNAHASLIEGALSTKCKIKPFKHNDVNHLNKLIEKTTGYSKRFMITESVFSTEGSIAPFDLQYDICMKNDVIPIIDDSHGIGVIGKNGRGILQEKNITDFMGVYTASTGKALGASGGLVSSIHEVTEYLRYNCSGYLYSTAISPVLLAGIKKSLEILDKDGASLIKKLSFMKKEISFYLTDSGFDLISCNTPICSIQVGSPKDTFSLSKFFYDHRILATTFVYPSVPKNKGVIRFIPRIDINKQQLGKIRKSISIISQDFKKK